MADNLSKYRAKRDFQKTNQPSGQAQVKPSNRRRFVIQKHDATRLHYDLRLELDGVFKSWAVTKGRRLIRMTSAWPSRLKITRSTTATSKAPFPKVNMAVAR
jgi:DNA ligase D-like protein (predicted 3'-phosphoesterase)